MEKLVKATTGTPPVYIFLDAEFGGLEKEKYSLLTVYLEARDSLNNLLGELYLYVKPDDGIYKVCASAMTVNKIDLVAHDKIAITYKEAGTKLFNWLRAFSDDGRIKLIPVGHGVLTDIEWITYNLISVGSWQKFVSYRELDTGAAVRFLIACNLFPDDIGGSLISLAKFLDVEVDESSAHDAKYDTELTFKVFVALSEYLKKRYKPIIDKNFGYSVGDVLPKSST
jgi:DNA polymerase III alpha subunit (gram-positive type)